MTFNAHETSTADGDPVSLFLFQYGSEVVARHRYTNADADITFEGEVYSAVPIEMGNVKYSGKLDRANMKIKVSNDSALAAVFRGYPPSYPVTVVVREGHESDVDAEFIVSWTGTIIAHSREKLVLELSAEPVSSTLKRPGLRRNYQKPCPHVLFGAQCGASQALATVSTTVASLSGAKMTPEAGWFGAQDPTKYTGGLLTWGTPDGPELRSVLRVEAATGEITMSGLPTGLAVADAVDVTLGCNHTMADCAALHDRILSFGGCPWIPTNSPIHKNPF